MYILASDKPSRVFNNYASEIEGRRRAVILVEAEAEIPTIVRVAADMIMELPPVSARDLQVTCRVAFSKKISKEDAEEALRHPSDLLWAALRLGRPVDDALNRLAAITAETGPGPRRSAGDTPKLSAMYGYGPAKGWGIQLATDLKDWQSGKIGWDDVDRGIILSGPPGVGKTVFAKAVASECGANLVATSLGQWQACGHLGDLLKAMRGDFAAAKKSAPSILFIDEIDSVGNRERFTHDNRDYSTQVVNAFLECLDGVDGREGVIVVGATNNFSRIDPAIVRSGRLDRHIAIPLPNADDRVGILSQHLGGQIRDDDLRSLVLPTHGMSGADLAKAVRDARRISRRAGREIVLDDIVQGLPPVFKLSDEHRRANAIHEAGHTIVGIRLRYGTYVGTQVIDQIVLSSGSNQTAGAAYFQVPAVAHRMRQSYLDQIAMVLAGIAAEEIVLGCISDGAGSGRTSDLATATRIATMMETMLGMGATFVHSLAVDDAELEKLRLADRDLAMRVSFKLNEQFQRAKEILQSEIPFLQVLAEELAKRGSLTPERFNELDNRSGNRNAA